MASLVSFSEETQRSFCGEVAITDPCYFFSHSKRGSKLWSRVVDLIPYDGTGILRIGNARMLVSRTAYGDGIYYVQPNRRFTIEGGWSEFPVDAGLFCVVDVDSIKNSSYLVNSGLDLAFICKLSYPVIFSVDGTGKMRDSTDHIWVDTIDNFYKEDE